jgi:hypothetical protein
MGHPSQRGRGPRIVRVSILTVLLLALPLLGVALQGKPISQYLEFPPKTRYVAHASFSWLAFWACAALIGCFVAPFVRQYLRTRRPFARKGRPLRPCGLDSCMDALSMVFDPPAPHLYPALALLHPGGKWSLVAAERSVSHDPSD